MTAVFVFGSVAIPNVAFAQPKGAERLSFFVRNLEQTSTVDRSSVCSKCVDSRKEKRSSSPRAQTVTTSHECSSCETKIATKGSGKMATNQVTHGCGMAGKVEGATCH